MRLPDARKLVQRLEFLREWSEIPRMLARLPLVNFEYNPNVAPTEQVPAFLAEPGITALHRLRTRSCQADGNAD